MADAVPLSQEHPTQLALRAQFERAGLQFDGVCSGLSRFSLQWRQPAALLEDLSTEEADALGALMPLVRARAGQALIKEGDVGDWMLLLLSGTVDVIKTSESGEVSRLAVIKQGTAVGEMSMLDAAPRYATCLAIEDVQAGVLTRAVIARLIQDQPAIGAKLLVKLTQLLAQRLRNTSNQLVKQLQRNGAAAP
ncbi:MAG: cyclic nucleotide-binding domain-containing protein [Rhodoferax sp.]|nr:cyclic nucleotide-binding domain-containing protein [Rhodoferax sp.]